MDQLVWAGEQKQQKQFYPLRFQITKERLQMYIGLKNAAQAKIQLDKLAETAGLAKERFIKREPTIHTGKLLLHIRAKHSGRRVLFRN